MSRSFIASTLFLLGGSIPASCNQPWIAGYTPMTFVNDHAEIDLDQREIEKWLDVGIFQQAERIYSVGAHSQSIARLTLVDAKPPAKPFPVGTLVYGTSTTGNGVQGRIVTETYWNDSTEEIIAFVEYDREKGADHSSHCQVGALAATSSAVKGGCEFARRSNSL